MRRPAVVDPNELTRVMRDALTSLRDGTPYPIQPVTRRALTRRGLVQRVACGDRRGPGIPVSYRLAITEAGRAALAAALVAA